MMSDLDATREGQAFLDVVRILNPLRQESRVNVLRKVLKAFKEADK